MAAIDVPVAWLTGNGLKFAAVMYAGFRENMFYVSAHGTDADIEKAGNHIVAFTFQ